MINGKIGVEELPLSCAGCDFCYQYRQDKKSLIRTKCFLLDQDIVYEGRLNNCPLVGLYSLPQHGFPMACCDNCGNKCKRKRVINFFKREEIIYCSAWKERR